MGRQAVLSITTGRLTSPVPRRRVARDSMLSLASSSEPNGPVQLYRASCQYQPAGQGSSANFVAYHCEAQYLGFRCCDIV